MRMNRNSNRNWDRAKLWYHVVIAAAIRQWYRQWLQISDVCFVHLLVQYSARTRYNQMDSNLANLDSTI